MGRTVKALWAAFFFSIIPGAQAQSAGWTISESAGRVTIGEGSRVAPGQRGTVIAPGAVLSTGPGARVVVVRGRDFMTLAANSRVRVPAAAERRGLLQIVQEWGNAVFQIEKQSAPHFSVRTPYLAAVVKGTTFSITVTQEGASLQVVEGAVETSTIDGGAVDLIRPGIVASVTRGDPMRLTVHGQDTRQIDSPQRVAPVEPASPKTGAATPAPVAGDDSVAAFEGQVIAAPIAAQPIDLGRATAGLVTGSHAVPMAGLDVAVADSKDRSERGASEDRSNSTANAADGNSAIGKLRASEASESRGDGNAGANGNGGDQGNSGSAGNGNGTGDGNAGANGNGDDQGNSGSAGNGNGTGDGNAGANGNGDDQGNSGSTGNGNGTGDGNAGANGNGDDQGNSGSAGNGNGTGNGNAGANGNGNAGANGNGDDQGNSGSAGNGNGNGNAGANGNGNN